MIAKDILYGAYEADRLDLYTPEKAGFDTVIVFHGGGLEKGSKNNLTYMNDLTDAGCGVVCADYRMYPDAKFPDFVEDAAQAVRWVQDHIAEYGGSGNLYVSGHSAGAYLTMMLCLAEKYLAEAGVDRSHIKGYSSDAAQIMTHFNVLRERGINSRLERIDEAAPIYWFSEKSDFPKLLLIWYTEDIVCRPEENKLFLRNVERVNPALAARITACELEGKHCSGCKPRPSGETPPYVKLLLEFMK